jgi:cyclopropane-fatty-acyl-phospholipid synthase
MSTRTDFLSQEVERLLSFAGMEINGSNPWDPQIHDTKLYKRILKEGSLGLGEAYMEGLWDVKELDVFFTKVLGAQLDTKIDISWKHLLMLISSRLLNFQTKRRARIVGKKHYDIGDDLYKIMLDQRLVYTCAYWQGNPVPQNLDEAQEAKLDLVCRKLNLQKGQKILDIGCGWGSFAKYAAEKYGVEVVGITISENQVETARELCRGYPIEIRLQDYRDVQGSFDHIVSLGMFEHVGYKNYRSYMELAAKVLKDNGLFLLHTIGNNISNTTGDPWLSKYIFPNGMLPSLAQIGSSLEGIFVLEDLHNFGAHYDKTLMAWYNNIHKNRHNLPKAYDAQFQRMWDYYLLCCAACFRGRHIQLWQMVLSKKGVPGGYLTVR